MSQIEIGRAKAQYNLADGGDIHSLEKSLGNDFVDRIAEANGTKGLNMSMKLEDRNKEIYKSGFENFKKDIPKSKFEKIMDKIHSWIHYQDRGEKELKAKINIHRKKVVQLFERMGIQKEYDVAKIPPKIDSLKGQSIYLTSHDMVYFFAKHNNQFTHDEFLLIKSAIEDYDFVGRHKKSKIKESYGVLKLVNIGSSIKLVEVGITLVETDDRVIVNHFVVKSEKHIKKDFNLVKLAKRYEIIDSRIEKRYTETK